jgi:hypothetical protein
MRSVNAMSPHDISALVEELNSLIRLAGVDGGCLSPSIYETAQLLRFHPARHEQAFAWLLNQQRADGAWGDPPDPLYRIVPTLAAALAVHRYSPDGEGQSTIAAALAFLNRVPPSCLDPLPDAIPVAFELILPKLLDDAEAAGLHVQREPFVPVIKLGGYRRARMAAHQFPPHAPPFLSWEAWGTTPLASFVDGHGGVGHSPAATAWWLHCAQGSPDLVSARRNAEQYLSRAAAATGYDIRGVVPPLWPITRFEQSFVLHTLLIADLLPRCELRVALRQPLHALYHALKPSGVGFSDNFAPDGDDTAAALAVLHAAGFDVSPEFLSSYQHESHFSAYPLELHSSLTVTARATHALAQMGHNVTRWQQTVAAVQQPDGWWYGDKWNASRYYCTCLALLALRNSPFVATRRAALHALLAAQCPDGGWGSNGAATPVESAYALLSLYLLQKEHGLQNAVERAVTRGRSFLWQVEQRQRTGYANIWVGKDLFSVPRIDRTFVLAALLTPFVSHRWLPAQEQPHCTSRDLELKHDQ